MIVIKSKCGASFQAMSEDYMDAEMKLNIAYYKAQGCIIETVENLNIVILSDECKCEYCQQIEHEFDILIEQVKDSEWN